jgi:HlyD family secretion protein
MPSLKRDCLLTTVILLSGIFFSSCGNSNNKSDASGTFEATEVIVSSEATGRILSLQVEEGDLFAAGQNVGYIDSVQLYLHKKQLLANIKAIESRRPEISKQIAAIEQQIATQKTERQRFERLVTANAANQKQVDDINAQIAVLNKQLTAEESTLSTSDKGLVEDAAALRLQVEQLDDQLAKCKIINPIKGTVLVKYVEANEVTADGKALYKIADTEKMLLRAYITSGQLTQIKLGQTVKVYADYGDKDSKEYSGKIQWISDKAEFTPKTIQTKDERANLVYAIKVAVKNDGLIKIGMYGEVKFN